MKDEPGRLISRKPTENIELSNVYLYLRFLCKYLCPVFHSFITTFLFNQY